MILAKEYKDNFWASVCSTAELLREKTDNIDALQAEVGQMDIDKQNLFYHSEPIDIVRDITGRFELTSEEKTSYEALRKKENIMRIISNEKDPIFYSISESDSRYIYPDAFLEQVRFQEQTMRHMYYVQLRSESEVEMLSIEIEKIRHEVKSLKSRRNFQRYSIALLIGASAGAGAYLLAIDQTTAGLTTAIATILAVLIDVAKSWWESSNNRSNGE